MTVGLYLTNGRETIAISDCLMQVGYRESASTEKLKEFTKNSYHGAILGAGSLNRLASVIKNLDEILQDEIEKSVEALHKYLNDNIHVFTRKFLDDQKRKSQEESRIYTHKKKKQEFIEKQEKNALKDLNEWKNENSLNILLVTYDKKAEKMRHFDIGDENHIEAFVPTHQIGAGRDGADAYFKQKLQNIKTENLSESDLFFLAVNGYLSSTMNKGVNGTPTIAQVTKEGVEIMSKDKTRTQTNLIGAYVSKYSPRLTQKKARELCKEILTKDFSDYQEITKILKLNEVALKTMVSSWHERSNEKHFKNNPE